MMSNKGDNEERIMCPYNPSHLLIPNRFQTHLVKCRKNYPDTENVQCLYNSTHRVPKPELAFHHDNCYDRLGLDKFVYAASGEEDKFDVPLVDVAPTETWDDDDRPSYNPEEHCLNNPILRKKDTLSKAQRKNFRWEERQRMQQFHNAKKETDETPAASDSHPRRPHTFSKGVTSTNELVEDDVSDMLKKIHLGANTATVPRLKDPRTAKDAVKTKSENPNKEDEKTENVNPNIPKSPVNSKVPMTTGVQTANGTKPKTYSRGRGSVFNHN